MIIKKITGLVLLLMVFQGTIAQQVNEVYNFPLRPGMPKWKELKTHTEMLNVLQIPHNIMRAMSTCSLIETCLKYPLFSDIWAYDNIKEGFEQLRKDFNGFDELLNRKDAAEELLKLYKKMDPNKINEKISSLDKGKYTFGFCKIEILLAQPELMKNSSQYQKKLLLEEIINKHEQMLRYNEFDIRSIETNIFLMGNVLERLDFSMKTRIDDKKINDFISTSKSINKEIILKIIVLAKEFLNNQ